MVVCVSTLTIRGACCRAGRSTRAGLARRSRTGEAQTVLDRYHEAVGAEPRITGDLQALGLNLWNLQFRVKSASGTVDKVLNRGKRFELQFHTPESLQAKESVHVLYERLRRPDVTPAEREEVCRAMDATFSSLEVPVDVLTARR